MSAVDSRGEITVLLDEWRAGQPQALDQLAPFVYHHLHGVAEAYLLRERSDHTLQATGLVHEVFLRLMQSRSVTYKDRTHFYSFAAKLMRRILVDYARKHKSQKRGDGLVRIPLAPELAWIDAGSDQMLDLDSALDELAALDPVKVQTLEIRYFLGATVEETADLMGHSRATVDRAIRFSVSWLHARLTNGHQPAAQTD